MIQIQPIYILVIYLFCFTTGFRQTRYDERPPIYSISELKSDLHFLKEKLERIHPALYRYISKSSLNSFFDSLDHAIVRPMAQGEFLSLISLLNAKIRDGHTMFLLGDSIKDYNNTKGRFLPFSFFTTQGKLHVVENCSRDSSIQQGEEILSINGTSASDILSQLIARQIRDGQNQTYPIWILNHYFAAYYSFVFGQPEFYTIEFKNSNGAIHKEQVMALTKDSIRILRQSRFPIQFLQETKTRGIAMNEDRNRITAVITIKSFDTDVLKDLYLQHFKPVVDSLFSQLKLQRVQDLVLDLRDNQGGDFESGRYLLSYLLKEPSRYLLDGKESRLIQIQANHFTGKLFVLINGGTFSNAAIVCAELEKNQRAVFIGDETGGNKYIISGNAEDNILLNTKIRTLISTTTFRIRNGIGNGHGLIPTYEVRPTIEDLLANRDIAKSFALNLILKN